jgi:hypothetical protein
MFNQSVRVPRFPFGFGLFLLSQIHRLRRSGDSACQLGGFGLVVPNGKNFWTLCMKQQMGQDLDGRSQGLHAQIFETNSCSLNMFEPFHLVHGLYRSFAFLWISTHATHTIPYRNLNRIHCSEETYLGLTKSVYPQIEWIIKSFSSSKIDILIFWGIPHVTCMDIRILYKITYDLYCINLYPFYALPVLRSQIPGLIQGGSGGLWCHLVWVGVTQDVWFEVAAPERPPRQLHINNDIQLCIWCTQMMHMHKC